MTARRLAAALAAAALLLAGCSTSGGGSSSGGAASGSASGAASGGSSGSSSASGAPDVSTMHSVLQQCPAPSPTRAAGATTLPALQLPCLGGGTLDLGSAPGVPTVVNLWGSWCPPCRAELPVLQQFADAAGDKVRVLGVISKDGALEAESFAEDAELTFPGAFDGQGQLMTRLGINALPVTFFLDAHGAVTYRQVGPVGSAEQLRQLVADHLGVHL